MRPTDVAIRAEVGSGERSGIEVTPTFFANGRHDGRWGLAALLGVVQDCRSGRPRPRSGDSDSRRGPPPPPIRRGVSMTDQHAPGVPVARGVATIASAHGYATTLGRLQVAILAGGLSLVARVDHAAAAARVGLTMPPTAVLVFGDPRVGTPLMLEAPLLALDLPLRLLVQEDARGGVWVSCNDAGYLANRYGLPADRAVGVSRLPEFVRAALGGDGER
jgi:uncharacterized protein (DUF302 family)